MKRERNSRWWHSTVSRLLRDEAYTGTGHALKLVAKGYSARYTYYVCGYGAGAKGAHPGNYNRVRIPEIDPWAWRRFSAWLRGDSFADDLRRFQSDGLGDRLAREKEEAQRSLQDKARQIENLTGLARDASPRAAKSLLAEIERVEDERHAVEARLRRIERGLADKAARESMAGEILTIRDEIAGEMDSFEPEEKWEVMRLFGVKIYVGGPVEDKWRFYSDYALEVSDGDPKLFFNLDQLNYDISG